MKGITANNYVYVQLWRSLHAFQKWLLSSLAIQATVNLKFPEHY
jgi:heme-degrading monooxygenase HmoA